MFSNAVLALTSLSLSTDAFAAALARGASDPRARTLQAVRTGAIFGATEGLMCLIGWLAASIAADWITAIDHWAALILLTLIGVSMIRNGLSDDAADDEAAADAPRRSVMGTVVTAIGTSIDSAAVGIALALAGAPVWSALAVGSTSFLFASLGYRIGPKVAERMGNWAEVAGGVVLIGIGITIFISHVTAPAV